ncbi:hypothetical protein [Actinomadura terrae]|uniref:hypothetical protein n=1 Tax=Actinomadura terrae TaxID=604353 RepID=UPI001FA7550D|nr:hypothetical protein [Actinomadura terrae]
MAGRIPAARRDLDEVAGALQAELERVADAHDVAATLRRATTRDPNGDISGDIGAGDVTGPPVAGWEGDVAEAARRLAVVATRVAELADAHASHVAEHERRARALIRRAPAPRGRDDESSGGIVARTATGDPETNHPAAAPPPTATPTGRQGGRPPRGLLSEPLWRALVEVYGTGEHGLSYRRQSGAWSHLGEYRYRRGQDRFVTDIAPGGGPSDRDEDRRWITPAGREHVTAHAARYAELYPHVVLREPGERAADPLVDPNAWRVLVGVATGALADGPWQAAGFALPGWDGPTTRHRLGEGIHRHLEHLRDLGLVAVDGGRYALTPAGHAHYATHHAAYRHDWPDVPAPAPRGRDDEPPGGVGGIVAPGPAEASETNHLDRDEVFDAIEDVVAEVVDAPGIPQDLLAGLPDAPGGGFADALEALVAAHEGASGDGPLEGLVAAAAMVVRTRPPHLPARAERALRRLQDALDSGPVGG